MVNLDADYIKPLWLLLQMLGWSILSGFVAGGVLGGSFGALIIVLWLLGSPSPSLAQVDAGAIMFALLYPLAMAASIGGLVGIIVGTIAGIINGFIISFMTLFAFFPLSTRRLYRPIMRMVSTLVTTSLALVLTPAILDLFLRSDSSGSIAAVPALFAGCIGFWFGGRIAMWYEGEVQPG